MTPNPFNWFAAGLAFVAVALGVISMIFVWEWWREQRRRRKVRHQLHDLKERDSKTGVGSSELFRDGQRSDLAWLQPFLDRIPQRLDIQNLLDQGALDWSVGTFLMLTLGLALSVGLSALIMGLHWSSAAVVAAMGALLPYAYVRRKRTRRLRQFEEQFPEAIDLLGRSIRAGHAFATGLQVVAEESPDPMGAEFRQIFEEMKFGLPLSDSLLALADRVRLVDVRIFVTAILIQRDVGGNLAEILDKIAYTVRERFMIQRQIRVYTAQGRLTGYLLAALPIIMGFVIYVLNSEYMRVLFLDPIGRFMLIGAGAMQIIGFFVIRRIIDIEI